tara:strand:+ start:165 stop:422 length:258 start_codon:yes stop_codon:yes gene_type:complete
MHCQLGAISEQTSRKLTAHIPKPNETNAHFSIPILFFENLAQLSHCILPDCDIHYPSLSLKSPTKSGRQILAVMKRSAKSFCFSI